MGYPDAQPGVPGTAPAAASSQRREPSLPVIVLGDKPADAIVAYYPTLRWLERVAELEGAGLRAHQLHAHPKGTTACFTAETDFDEKTITWCTTHGSPDKRSAIHELAHLISDDAHTVYWAHIAFELADKYLSPRDAARLKREIGRDYPAGRSTYHRATGAWLR